MDTITIFYVRKLRASHLPLLAWVTVRVSKEATLETRTRALQPHPVLSQEDRRGPGWWTCALTLQQVSQSGKVTFEPKHGASGRHPGGLLLILPASRWAVAEDSRWLAEGHSDVKWVREQMKKGNLTCLGFSMAGVYPCEK